MAVLMVFAMISCGGGGDETEYVNVTFHYNYDGAPAALVKQVEKSTAFGSAFPASPTRAAAGTKSYTFQKWSTASEGAGGSDVTAATVFSADTTVYARWIEVDSATQATVTFDKNGGDGTNTVIVVTKGTAIGSQFPTAVPTRTNYTFVNWTDAVSGGTAVTASTVVNANLIAYAQWTGGGGNPDISYIVTFDKNNTDEGSTAPEPATRTVTSGSTVTNLPGTDPIRPGYIFVNYNTKADGTGDVFKIGPANLGGTVITANITVYAQWKAGYVVTFNKNTTDSTVADPNPPQVELVVETLGDVAKVGAHMPTALTREAFAFKGWNQLAEPEEGEEDETEFTGDTEVTASITVYAQWEFVGGTPKVVDGRLVVTLPLFELDAATSADVNLKTGVYKGTGGNFDYKFPDEVYEGGVAQYDYFVILTEITNRGSFDNGNLSGVNLQQYGTTTTYGGAGPNKQPWLDNADGKKILQYINGAGSTGGIRINANGTNVAEFKILSIIFYKLPLYSVSFEYSGFGTNKTVNDIIGKDENLNGSGVGASNWAADPTDRTGETPPKYFLGWYDLTVLPTVLYGSGTPIFKDTVLTAQWTETEPAKVEFITVPGDSGTPVYRFTLTNQWDGNSVTGKAVSKLTWKVWVVPGTAGGNRMHVIIPQPTSGPVFTSLGEYRNTGWAAIRAIIVTGNNNDVGLTLKKGKNKAGEGGGFGEWVTYEYHIGPAAADITNGDASSTFESNGSWVSTNYFLSTQNEVYLAFGLSSNVTGGTTYYMKDVALILEDGTVVKNDSLTATINAGATTLQNLYFTATNTAGSNRVLREMKYSPDGLPPE